MTVQLNSSKPEEEVLNTRSNQEVLDQLLKPEVQESLTALIEQLPKLTELLNVLNKSYDFAQSVATDDVLKNDTVSAIKEISEPVVASVKNIAATAIEAKDRAEESNKAIGLFDLLKMIKDPQAQKLFRFVNAYLQVASEREK
ncbi:DUF1641 domain-containing protein [Metabacillus fastidiosus]|uniref:DUF1641 domain-containing protein n=1 Tax=Metabacillus fastidiosus TaxID=1458 RepID=A0ABU6NYJ8_9BACI|nr:DUF1641 domain-containing protein [Metabacillus fastidiosus]MEC2077768.1 DUF1641 domain-containing protein [Metabacillus fastidiosus]MED4402209.1 DUF1641 domain-containing protein [Metabacillus fastidiosus]MED4455718.1 DUF1641 domain-containing protein [Metabacillus fastidiosus]MED4462078.1 DUF1641 domain-containing protein [Metabacillus fastidiosus]MED4531625.1 DUF1641 domain-containing protein [Metabacillus fastidiosus]